MAKKIKAEKANDLQFTKSNVDEIFNLVKKDEKVVITVGNYRVSKHEFNTFEEADEYIAKRPYDLIINLSSLAMHLELNKNKEK